MSVKYINRGKVKYSETERLDSMSVKYINRGKVKYSETERLDFSQVHLEQFLLFAIV